MNNRAIVVQPNGSVEIKSLAGYNDIKAELNDGWLELVRVGEQFVLYVDEDGISKNLHRNQRATDVVVSMLAKLDRSLLPNDYIKGPAIFIGQSQSDDPEEGMVESDLPLEIINEYFPDQLNDIGWGDHL